MDERPLFTIFGGTGFLGGRVVRQLSDAGCRVRIAARHPERRRELLTLPRIETVRADLFDDASLRDALSGATGALNATSLYVESGGTTFEAVHVEAAGRLAGEARAAGLRRFVQMSGIGADSTSNDAYIRSRGRGEDAVRQAFADAAIVRSAVMFGHGDGFLGTIRDIARRSPVFPLFGAGRTRLQPVHAGDVAAGVVHLLREGPAASCHEFAGPRIYSYRELVELVAAAKDLRTRPVPVPFAAWDAMATVSQHLPGAPLTRSQVALMRIDNVASGTRPGLRDLGVAPRDVEAVLYDER